jgi:hypothetical protein
MRPKTAQTVIDTFTKLIDEQCSKGLSKYGTTIDEAQDENYDWNRMALEEAVDLSQYLVREVGKLQEQIKRYEKVLYALCSMAIESDQDVTIDIITDALSGFDLMEQYEKYATDGKNQLKDMLIELEGEGKCER